jgi:hypothetical protein
VHNPVQLDHATLGCSPLRNADLHQLQLQEHVWLR